MDILSCAALVLTEIAFLPALSAGRCFVLFRTFSALFLVHYVVLKIYRIVIYPKFFSPLRHLPGPKDHGFLVGQELRKFTASSPMELNVKWQRTWPDAPFLRYISVAGKEVLVANTLAAWKAVIQTHCYQFPKPAAFKDIFKQTIGLGLVAIEGDEHKHQRRLLVGLFSFPSARQLYPVFSSKMKQLTEVFGREIEEKDTASIEVTSMLFRVALNIIGLTSMGIELDEMTPDPQYNFSALYETVLHGGPVSHLMTMLNAYLPLRKILPLEVNRRFLRAKKGLDAQVRGIVRGRIADMNEDKSKPETPVQSDFLSFMLEESMKASGKTGQPLWSEDELIANVLTFVAAGHETTALTITWAVYCLATNHHVQDKLREEVHNLLADAPEPSFDAVCALPYMNNFVREVLRLFSPTYYSVREAAEDVIIEGVNIPKGTQIDVMIHAVHRSRQIWGDDVDEFKPERWDALTGDAASNFAFESFLQGPRICIGRNVALATVKAALVELVRHWRFVGIENNDGSGELLVNGNEEMGRGVRFETLSILIRPKGGLRVRYQRVPNSSQCETKAHGA